MEEYDLLQCIDKGLEPFGSNVKQSIFWKMCILHNYSRVEVLDNPELLVNVIRETLGDSSAAVEESVANEITRKFAPIPEGPGYDGAGDLRGKKTARRNLSTDGFCQDRLIHTFRHSGRSKRIRNNFQPRVDQARMAFSEFGIDIANLAGFLALFFIIVTAVMMFIKKRLFNRFQSHRGLIRNIHIIVAVLEELSYCCTRTISFVLRFLIPEFSSDTCPLRSHWSCGSPDFPLWKG